jgi:hypothetical protein
MLYYLAMARKLMLNRPGIIRIKHMEQLEAQHDNMRTALAWSRAAGGVEIGSLEQAVAMAQENEPSQNSAH